ncbi:glycosyltransferase family 4 protein [Gulosibacter molinativorax]|nr:glycosyltransferase family 4 protein [Gulosibacter molinativorax]
MSIDVPLRALVRSPAADALLCVLEQHAVLPAKLRKRRLPPYRRMRLATISCWWAEEIQAGSTARIQEIRSIAKELDRIYVFSQNQVDIFAEIGIQSDRVLPVDFGVDHDFFTPAPTSTRRFQVLSVGIDRGRDYQSLVDAARLLPAVEFQIFTQAGRFSPDDLPRNVTVNSPVSLEEHRENLRSAKLVVIPTHDLAYPTGQSVLLEASACARPVLITDTEPMREYVIDGETGLFMPLHDAEGVASSISSALADEVRLNRIGKAARRSVESKFNFDSMWETIADDLRGLTTSKL